MQKFSLLVVTFSLLFHSISGRPPERYAAHAHILLGYVTLEQLRAHEAEEARDTAHPLETVTVLRSGIILSVAHGADDSRAPVLFALLLCAPTVPASPISHLISFPRLPELSLALPPQDPPPRFNSRPV